MTADGLVRCFWCGTDPLEIAYHDSEWGRPCTEDRLLFEKLILESFQSGLSWRTILTKRDGFRNAFAGFDFDRVAQFGAGDIDRLLSDSRIVRHRGKITSAIENAKVAQRICERHGSLYGFVRRFTPDAHDRPAVLTEEWLRAARPPREAAAMAREWKTLGGRFLGPTTVYAFFQAAGLVNDHVHDCAFRNP